MEQKLTEFIKILVCPKCGDSLELDTNKGAILCYSCNLSYPVSENIPIMLIDNAVPINKNIC